MKMTLLEMTQDILNDADGDEVNSIDDTSESVQVAQIIRTTYYAMMSNRNWPHLRRLIQTNNPKTDKPTHLTLKDEVTELCFINYDVRAVGEEKRSVKELRWVSPEAFLRKCNSLDNTKDNVKVVTDSTGVELLIATDRDPETYTSFDDSTLVFDAYDSEKSDTLMSSRVQAMGYVSPEWTHSDDFIPDLPDEAFIALLEKSKDRAIVKLKQYQDITAADEASRQQRWLARKAWRVAGGLTYPDYGRHRR